MKRRMTWPNSFTTKTGIIAVGIAVLGGTGTMTHGMWTGIDLEVTYSSNLTVTSANAYAVQTGSNTYYLDGYSPITTDLSDADADSGVNSAHAAVAPIASVPFDYIYYSNGNPLYDGHSGNVAYYAQMSGNSAESSVAVFGATIELYSSAYFLFSNYERKDSYLLESDRWFASSASLATTHVNAPPNTTVQSVSIDVDVRYIFGLAEYDLSGTTESIDWYLADPAGVFNLNIGGQHVSGGYIINEAGDISTFGDMSYDGGTGAFSFDASSLVNMDVSGDSTVEFKSDARLPGDFNGDEVVDATDIDLLYGQIASSYTPTDVFDIYDLNIDGVVDAGADSDVEVLVETVLMTIVGDANLDRFVGQADLNAVLGNWNQSGVGYAGGDLDGDDYVGITDLNLVLNNWNWGTPPSVGASVPEPATMALLVIGTSLIGRRSRR